MAKIVFLDSNKPISIEVSFIYMGNLTINEIGEIDGISQRMLTVTVRALERDGLVTRHIYAEIPPRVEYQLTDLGRSLLI